MKRSELKAIVKECLVEVLAEALVPAMEKIREARQPVNGGQLKEGTFMKGGRNGAPMRPRQSARSVGQNNVDVAGARRRVAEAFTVADTASNNKQRVASRGYAQQDVLRANELAQLAAAGPVTSDIFADTALTTLRTLDSAERSGPTVLQGDIGARAAARAEPHEIGDPSIWNLLTFGDNGTESDQ